MENFHNIINNNFLYNKKGKEIYHPIYLQRNTDKSINPLLMKEKFFNLKIYHTPNKNQKQFDKNFLRSSLDVKDINFKDNHLFKRETNPLEPKYKYDWQMTEVNEDRKIEYIDYNILGNYPKAIYPYKQKHNLNLDTYDIPGSQSDTKSPLSKIELRYGRKLQYSKDDIEGSHPGSLIKGIKTNRNTNPLEPHYPLIRGKLYEYEKEINDLRRRYDYKSLLDYYNNYSKNKRKNKYHERNDMKIKNEISVNINKLSRNKNYLEGFGKDKKFYPREKYENFKKDFKTNEKGNKYYIDI